MKESLLSKGLVSVFTIKIVRIEKLFPRKH